MEAAEKLKISAENLNSMLTTSLQRISETRKRTRKLRAVSILRKRRKKKESKIEVPSVFKKSVSKIKNKVAGGTGNLFGNILGFVSLLLLGVAITNIEMIQEKLNEARKKLTKKLEPVINVAKVIFEGARSFISLFETTDREKEYQQLLKDIKDLENLKKDFSKAGRSSEELEDTYREVESGRYAKKNKLTLAREGTLTDGSTYTYNADKKEYTVSSGMFKKKLTFTEFFSKYAETDIQNILKKDNSLLKKGDFIIGGFETDMLNNDEVSSNTNFNNNMIAYNGRNNDFLMDFDENLFSETSEIYYYQEVYKDGGIA